MNSCLFNRSKYFSIYSNFGTLNSNNNNNNGVLQITFNVFSQFSFANSVSHSVASEFLNFFYLQCHSRYVIGFIFLFRLLTRDFDPHSHFPFFNWIVLFRYLFFFCISISMKNAYYSGITIANKQINLFFPL